MANKEKNLDSSQTKNSVLETEIFSHLENCHEADQVQQRLLQRGMSYLLTERHCTAKIRESKTISFIRPG